MSTIFTSASSQFVLDHQNRRPSHSERRPSHADPARRPSHQDYLETHLPPNHHRRHSQTQQHVPTAAAAGGGGSSGPSSGQRRKSSSPRESRHGHQHQHQGHKQDKAKAQQKHVMSPYLHKSKLFNLLHPPPSSNPLAHPALVLLNALVVRLVFAVFTVSTHNCFLLSWSCSQHFLISDIEFTADSK
ncbi:hypothetical protein RRG08_025641 [Elysia crispata]|uniref:Uncharacterized protein n=1 Tax=Elysia crispata TaxID=231223 RepID=A0AAE0YE25_9GAST|nr:hypothetical protein RRG08_025641 [Elysia crispata]